MSNALVHAKAEYLDREHVVESVDDQSRQTISFGVDNPVGIRFAIQVKQRGAERDGFVDAAGPEFGSRRLLLSRQEPKTDLGATVPEREAEVNAIAVDHADDIAVIGCGRTHGPFDHFAIDELMRTGRADGNRRDGLIWCQAAVGNALGRDLR